MDPAILYIMCTCMCVSSRVSSHIIQVAEVVTSTKTRLTVNGWFHGPPSHRPEPYKEPILPLRPPLSLGVSVDKLGPVDSYVMDNKLSSISLKFKSGWFSAVLGRAVVL